MMEQSAKFYVDIHGSYIGSFDGGWLRSLVPDENGNEVPPVWISPEIPVGAIEVPTPPEHAGQTWDHETMTWSAPTVPVTTLYAVDLWSRLTDAEAEQVEGAMATQPVRVQNIFKAASSYRSDHELWSLLQATAVDLFGQARAAEILASS